MTIVCTILGGSGALELPGGRATRARGACIARASRCGLCRFRLDVKRRPHLVARASIWTHTSYWWTCSGPRFRASSRGSLIGWGAARRAGGAAGGARPRPIAGPLLGVEPSPPAGGCPAPGRPSRGQPERMPGAMRKRSAGGSQQPADLSSRSFTSPKNRNGAPLTSRWTRVSVGLC